MLTDNDVDRALLGAGARWRGASEEIKLRDLYEVVPGRVRRRPRARVVAAVVTGAGLVATVVALGLLLNPTRDNRTAMLLHPSQDTSSAGSAAAAFRMHLHLDATRAPADGRPIHGYVEITNTTGSPIVIRNECDGWIGVELTTPQLHYGLINGDVGCANGRVKTGTTRVAVTVSTRYQECNPGTTPTGRPDEPDCLKTRTRMPALPAGHYLALVETMSLARQPDLPKPIPVTLTAP